MQKLERRKGIHYDWEQENSPFLTERAAILMQNGANSQETLRKTARSADFLVDAGRDLIVQLLREALRKIRVR